MSERVTVRIADRVYEVDLTDSEVSVNGKTMRLDEIRTDNRCGVVFRAGEKTHRAIFDRNPTESFVLFRGREYPVEIETERDRLLRRFEGISHDGHHHAEIRASMPGLVVRVISSTGSSVEKGQALLILEAMKMENEVRAPADGVIKEICVQQGRAVEKGDLLVVLDS